MSIQPKQLQEAGMEVPTLPDKLFFSIREVSDLCAVEPHVLRYWETEFRHIRPVKKGGNRRFYRHRDIYAVLQIKHLLYDLNFTIRGAKKRLMSGDLNDIVEKPDAQVSLKQIREELVSIRDLLAD
ncbi:MAG: MerR family transcriptional regulator [Zetaproteobacteria bacterium CG_4_9_14_3_um_filter_49_83]|nr:MAG: MerR family transcriptional regulator [Zetaproteobacteria bacterium CG1_02_49_23]PIQ33480.1 MAG: MerR family transcriptional regulator [Zetaproteobacteria bacterium CG17_big_fil_post_rev_8_21_14_2_50_50_13]PIV29328.1 MAG: MerR family transcriptional regulator [Zetaproteobacteria bacterium CG02_land_8_20_14_3_00_50_9]PIY55687.1 MAG: MerR family transcriptional regulator [Zetaproteobacteria bacterium CG_4_10_14_0_8_um_filter_49_80]PJA36038.1 MAG: MerR family transcriptional regulator [Zet